MAEATHAEAVAALKSVTDVCQMTVSREVLVVMPDEEEEEGEGGEVYCIYICVLMSEYSTIIADGKGISRGAEWHKFQLHSTFYILRNYECGKNFGPLHVHAFFDTRSMIMHVYLPAASSQRCIQL